MLCTAGAAALPQDAHPTAGGSTGSGEAPEAQGKMNPEHWAPWLRHCNEPEEFPRPAGSGAKAAVTAADLTGVAWLQHPPRAVPARSAARLFPWDV